MAQCLLLILALLLTKLLMNSSGLLHRNRAVHGDIVVVELLHKSQWKGRSISLKSKDQGNEIVNGLRYSLLHSMASCFKET